MGPLYSPPFLCQLKRNVSLLTPHQIWNKIMVHLDNLIFGPPTHLAPSGTGGR